MGLDSGIHNIQIFNKSGKPVLEKPYIFFGSGIVISEPVLTKWKGYKVKIDMKDVGKVGFAGKKR